MDQDLITVYNKCAVDLGTLRASYNPSGDLQKFKGAFTALFYVSFQYRDLITVPGVPSISDDTLSVQISKWFKEPLPRRAKGDKFEKGIILFEHFAVALRTLGLLAKTIERHEVNHAI